MAYDVPRCQEVGRLASGEMPEVLTIIQARLGSTRLPGKVMLDLAGRPMLSHVIARMKRSRLTSRLIVVTTVDAEDLPIVEMARALGLPVFRGSATDPLQSFVSAARLYGADHVVRIKGDCPIIDAQVVDAAIRLHLDEGADYTGNCLQRSYPVGLDVEILSREALEKVWREAALRSEHEHITLYVHNHPELFAIRHLAQADDRSALRWTVDYPEDYDLVSRIFAALYPLDPEFGMSAVLDFLSHRPEFALLNAHVRADAGVQISLAGDAPVAG